jgi:glycosyltransferase involved in cell wall biosynthesis
MFRHLANTLTTCDDAIQLTQDPPVILHIITGLHDGGAEAVLFRLCTADRMFQHHVVSFMDLGKYGSLLQGRGIKVTCLNMPRGWMTVSGLWVLTRLIRHLKPNVVQTWMYHADFVGGLVAHLQGCRSIVWGIHNTTLVPGKSRRSTILVAKLCAQLSRLVPSRIVCCAQKAREVHTAIGYNCRRMQVIPNGYDLSVFQPDKGAGLRLRQEIGIEAAEQLIGFVARFDPQKDHENLLKALAHLKGQGSCPKCLLVGTGLDTGNVSLVKRIASLGLADRIVLLGRRSDIPAVMNALDLHVMSSSGEAFPNVLAEAMACGTPCVSTDVGDAAVIVGESGRIVPPRDHEALATAISELLAERGSEAWETRKEAARRHIADRFTIDLMVKSYHDLWLDVISETAPEPKKRTSG